MKKQWLTFCARFSSALVAHPIFYRRQHTTHKKKTKQNENTQKRTRKRDDYKRLGEESQCPIN